MTPLCVRKFFAFGGYWFRLLGYPGIRSPTLRRWPSPLKSNVFGSAPSTSAPAIRLAEVLDQVRALITHGLFYGASGVLTSVATYHPDLDFATICSGYATGCSTKDIPSLRESLLPHAKLLGKQVSAQWVMDAHHVDMVGSVC